jgi:hypothetical protein
VASRLPPEGADALLSALAAVNAYRAGLDSYAVPPAGSAEAALAFFGALAIAGKALDEVRRLGGDPEALLMGVYERAMVAA